MKKNAFNGKIPVMPSSVTSMLAILFIFVFNVTTSNSESSFHSGWENRCRKKSDQLMAQPVLSDPHYTETSLYPSSTGQPRRLCSLCENFLPPDQSPFIPLKVQSDWGKVAAPQLIQNFLVQLDPVPHLRRHKRDTEGLAGDSHLPLKLRWTDLSSQQISCGGCVLWLVAWAVLWVDFTELGRRQHSRQTL